MPPRPTSDQLPEELLVLVGKIAIQSVYVDMLLGELLGGLKNVHGQERARTIHILDTRRKTQDAEKFIKANHSGPEGDHVLAIISRAADLLADRNLVLHAAVGFLPEQMSSLQYFPFRGKYAGQPIPFSRETLEPIMAELNQLSSDLLEICFANEFSNSWSPSHDK
jgi:hypothetical protein